MLVIIPALVSREDLQSLWIVHQSNGALTFRHSYTWTQDFFCNIDTILGVEPLGFPKKIEREAPRKPTIHLHMYELLWQCKFRGQGASCDRSNITLMSVSSARYRVQCSGDIGLTLYNKFLFKAFTYDHRTLKPRLPVRSALFKQRTGGLVVRWVTTSEYPLLYVFELFCSAGHASTSWKFQHEHRRLLSIS